MALGTRRIAMQIDTGFYLTAAMKIPAFVPRNDLRSSSTILFVRFWPLVADDDDVFGSFKDVASGGFELLEANVLPIGASVIDRSRNVAT